jgi:transposase
VDDGLERQIIAAPGFGLARHRRYTGIEHALCNAHHLRELTAAAEAGHGWAGLLAGLFRQAHRWVTAGDDQLDPGPARLGPPSYDGHLAQAAADTAGTKTKAALADRLRRDRADVLDFALDFRVPFDNNQAERDIRMVKLQQKSPADDAPCGAQAFCTIRSYLSTARKHGHRPSTSCQQARNGQPWLPATCKLRHPFPDPLFTQMCPALILHVLPSFTDAVSFYGTAIRRTSWLQRYERP